MKIRGSTTYIYMYVYVYIVSNSQYTEKPLF